MDGIGNVRSYAKTWQRRKVEFGSGRMPSMDGLRKFTESMNLFTRSMIAEFQEFDPDFWTSLAELATNAATLTDRDAKLIVNGKDRKQL